MKCLIFTAEFPPGPGGMGTHAYAVASHLHQRGWSIRVLAHQDYASASEARDFNAAQPFDVCPLPRPRSPVSLWLSRARILREQLRQWRPDVVLATGDRAIYCAAGVCGRSRVPWIAVEHGRYVHGIERRIKRWAYARADALVCVSRYTWSQTEAMGILPRRLAIIPNGAAPERFQPLPPEEVERFRTELGLQGKALIVTVGSVTERKGQDVIIRALPRILERVQNACYVCAGLPVRKAELEALAAKLGVLDHVRFVGAVDHRTLVGILNCADLFVMSSRSTKETFEGYGIAAVEAALCGKPAVVTADSGLYEAIEDGVTGIGAPQEDSEKFASAIIRLLEDAPLRGQMGEAARNRALREQTWAMRAARYDALLREIGSESAQSPPASRLLIISHTPHYLQDGEIRGWGPTVREINHLSRLFAQTVHVAPLWSGECPASMLAYESGAVVFRPIAPAGGSGLRAKIGILLQVPRWIRTFLQEMCSADVIHVRSPSNVSFTALVLLSLLRRPRTRWAKYAGNWGPRPGDRDPLSFRLERWWLRKGLHRGLVTVNGEWPNQPAHVQSFTNPCLTEVERLDAASLARDKALDAQVRLLYVGALELRKGVRQALEILDAIRRAGVDARIDVVGDGSEREHLERLAAERALSEHVAFHGWLTWNRLPALYAAAHIQVHPSETEGWPKVLSEAMAHGVVPVASDVGSIPFYLKRCEVGRFHRPRDVEAFAGDIVWYAANPDAWKAESERCVQCARLFTYESYLEAVRKLLSLPAPSAESCAARESDAHVLSS